MPYIIAFLIIGAAGWILVRLVWNFKKTGGRSACQNCPYSGNCSGKCGKDKK